MMRKPKTNFISKYKYKRNLGVIAQFLWKNKTLRRTAMHGRIILGRDCTINSEIQFWKNN
jgi:hypothetical protein